jgi:ribosomal protein S18 acetylase RimI-like enzyme
VNLELRPAGAADLDFLAEMALPAAFRPGPLPPGAAETPHVTRWLLDWGRPGDVGVIAWLDGARVGAAWCRLIPDPVASDADGRPLPELAIAVSPEYRGQGIGTGLLDTLAEAAIVAGYSALALTVSQANPALRLYERAGFQVVDRDGSRLTMVTALGPGNA